MPKHVGAISDCTWIYQRCIFWCHEWFNSIKMHGINNVKVEVTSLLSALTTYFNAVCYSDKYFLIW